MGGRRPIIYIVIIAILALASYIHNNFGAESKAAESEVSVESVKRVESSEMVEKPKTEPKTEQPQSKPSTTTQAQTPAPKAKTAHPGWAELPAIKSNKEHYIASHSCGDRRNYTVCFSQKQCAPLWVAYPMHSSYTGNTKRTDNYDYDPSMPVNIQPRLNRSYGEYTRGHLLGSAERNVSREMNNQTFYVTNIAPQQREGFNQSGGAWNNLESFVDRQVCSDTLYVVTGCIYEEYTATDGSKIKPKTTTNKNDNRKIGVPTAYYKALLRTKSGKTGKSVMECKPSELKCAAFIVPHRSAQGHKPTAKDMISIKELEQLTGIDLFANLHNAPEQSAEAKDWGL